MLYNFIILQKVYYKKKRKTFICKIFFQCPKYLIHRIRVKKIITVHNDMKLNFRQLARNQCRQLLISRNRIKLRKLTGLIKTYELLEKTRKFAVLAIGNFQFKDLPSAQAANSKKLIKSDQVTN